MLATFDEVALQAILLYYPIYERIHSEIHVRITELPTSLTLRDLRQGNLNCLVRISGVVTRRSGVFPQLKYVKFDCGKCGAVLGPFFQDTTKELKISFCQNCEGRGPFSVNSEQVRFTRATCDIADPWLMMYPDGIPKLPEDDFAGIAWLSAGWPTASTP